MLLRLFIIFMFSVMLIINCAKKSEGVIELAHFPITGQETLFTLSDVEFDSLISSDGNGSMRITVTDTSVIELFKVDSIDVDNARLLYRCRVKSENMTGQAFLEMWCGFKDKGEFFSRGLNSPVTGTQDWFTIETPFFLKEGEDPDNIKLNFVINGAGTIWIDDITLLKAPLN